ncbi:unnamed protein product [Choristocarpus tenellus]
MARGKGLDVLSVEELLGYREPLLDVVVEPGQILYVPAGFPHTTDTVTRMDLDQNTEPSVHLTMGVDTHIWGLNYASLRTFSLARAGYKDPLVAGGPRGGADAWAGGGGLEGKVDDDAYWGLFSSLPMGFLGSKAVVGLTR